MSLLQQLLIKKQKLNTRPVFYPADALGRSTQEFNYGPGPRIITVYDLRLQDPENATASNVNCLHWISYEFNKFFYFPSKFKLNSVDSRAIDMEHFTLREYKEGWEV